MDVGSRWFLDSSVDLLGLVLGRQRGKAAALEQQSGNDGTGHEDQGGPQERGRVAMEQSCLEIGRGRCPTDQIGRGSTCGQIIGAMTTAAISSDWPVKPAKEVHTRLPGP